MGRGRGRVGAALVSAALFAGAAWAWAEPVSPGRPAPELSSGAWINSQPLTMRGLRGRVVLVDFWTYG